MDTEKKFDSAEEIMEYLRKEKITPERMYLGFINSIYDVLHRSFRVINGSPAEDFFIQGLITIPADVESFKAALDYFMKEYMDQYNMKY